MSHEVVQSAIVVSDAGFKVIFCSFLKIFSINDPPEPNVNTVETFGIIAVFQSLHVIVMKAIILKFEANNCQSVGGFTCVDEALKG